MRFVKEEDKSCRGDLFLPRRSLYVMRDAARYFYTHEILKNDDSFFGSTKVDKARRISVICRNAPSPDWVALTIMTMILCFILLLQRWSNTIGWIRQKKTIENASRLNAYKHCVVSRHFMIMPTRDRCCWDTTRDCNVDRHYFNDANVCVEGYAGERCDEDPVFLPRICNNHPGNAKSEFCFRVMKLPLVDKSVTKV